MTDALVPSLDVAALEALPLDEQIDALGSAWRRWRRLEVPVVWAFGCALRSVKAGRPGREWSGMRDRIGIARETARRYILIADSYDSAQIGQFPTVDAALSAIKALRPAPEPTPTATPAAAAAPPRPTPAPPPVEPEPTPEAAIGRGSGGGGGRPRPRASGPSCAKRLSSDGQSGLSTKTAKRLNGFTSYSTRRTHATGTAWRPSMRRRARLRRSSGRIATSATRRYFYRHRRKRTPIWRSSGTWRESGPRLELTHNRA